MERAKEEGEIIKTIIDYQNYLKKTYGFDWSNLKGVIDKLKEEIEEFEEVVNSESKNRIKEEFGDILITVVNLSRFLNIDIIDTLRESFNKFKRRVKIMEEWAERRRLDLKKMNIEELDKLWEEVKRIE